MSGQFNSKAVEHVWLDDITYLFGFNSVSTFCLIFLYESKYKDNTGRWTECVWIWILCYRFCIKFYSVEKGQSSTP
jgi:hypothetical protein